MLILCMHKDYQYKFDFCSLFLYFQESFNKMIFVV